MPRTTKKAISQGKDEDSDEEQSDELSNETELKRERQIESPKDDTSNSDIEAKQPRLSLNTMTENVVDEKHVIVLDNDCKDSLNSISTENKARRTSMRKCKVQALQKQQESIKKRAEDRLMRTEITDGLSFSSDDDGEQMDDSDQDPVWTPADKDRKVDQKKGNAWTHRRRSVIAQEKTLQRKSSLPETTGWETLNDEIIFQCQEQGSPTVREPTIEDRTLAIKGEKFQRKKKPMTSYKYTQSSHVIEGHFKAGNFVMALADKDKQSPPIWRIEGKSLLQRFEPFNDHGRLLYRNASSYSAWNSTTIYKYIGVNVLLVSHNRNSSVVENLGPISTEETMKFAQADHGPQIWLYNCPNGVPDEENKSMEETSTHPQQEAFEVFLQTLLSQVLDPSFIIEIIKENDDYFLTHLNSIGKITEEKKKKIFENNELLEQLRNMVETLPSINVLPNTDASNQMCNVCNETKGQHVVHCVGQPYDPTSLICQQLSEHKFPVNNKAPVCATCAHAVVLYSHMHHHKYNFFLKCKKKVDDVKSFKQNKEESHMLLEECLQDTVWVNQMFQEIKDMWSASDNLR